MAGRGRHDAKTRALAASRTLNPRPEKVTDPAFLGSASSTPGPGPGQVRDGAPGRGRGRAGDRAAAAFGFSRHAYYAAALR